MKKLFHFSFIIFALTCFNLALADSHGHHHNVLSFEKAWARPSIGKSKNSAVYLHIKNSGKEEITITSGRSDISERVELHTHIKEGDVMKMRPIEGGLKIPAGSSVELKPGGKHIMIMGLKKKLSKGDHFMVEVTTAKGKTSSFKVSVDDKGPSGHDHKTHSGHKGH